MLDVGDTSTSASVPRKPTSATRSAAGMPDSAVRAPSPRPLSPLGRAHGPAEVDAYDDGPRARTLELSSEGRRSSPAEPGSAAGRDAMALAVGSTETLSAGPVGASPTVRPRADDPVAGAGVGGRRGVPAMSGAARAALGGVAGGVVVVGVGVGCRSVVESARSSSSGGSTGGSNGPLRLRCASTSGATRRRSSTSVLSRPSSACVRGRRAAQHEVGAQTLGTHLQREPGSSLEHVVGKRGAAAGQCGETRDDRRRTPGRSDRTRAGGERIRHDLRRVVGARTSTHNPKRSSNCGRSSPSSGFIDPTRTNRARMTV